MGSFFDFVASSPTPMRSDSVRWASICSAFIFPQCGRESVVTRSMRASMSLRQVASKNVFIALSQGDADQPSDSKRQCRGDETEQYLPSAGKENRASGVQ